ncbi:MAG: TolC family protein [Bdellovibrionales bacterium]
MKANFIVILGVTLALPLANASTALTEAYLKRLISQKPPSVQQIEASFLGAKQAKLTQEDQLGLRIEGEGQIYKSDERLLNNFDGGVTARATSYSVGLVKPTRYGVDLGLKAFGSKSTNAFVTGAATNGASVSLSVDLYQNFLGRRTNNDLKKSTLSLQRAELEKKSSLKTFESNVRKLYWALVANNERHRLLGSLVKTAEKQYKESVKKKRSGAADSGEVARFRSQWSSRKADLLSLEYQKVDLLKSLKEILPELNGKAITMGSYSVEKTVSDVLACTQVIASHTGSPLKYTVYDEIVASLEKEEELERKVTSAHSGPNIKLVGEYATVGRGFGFGSAREDFYNESQPRTSLGLQISMPLDGRKKKTKEVIEALNKNRYQAEAKQNISKINAFHSETVRLVMTLREVIKNQKETNKYLAKSLRVSAKKYKQARISLQELIGEQDAHLQSQLKEIDSNLIIVNTLIDYFSIYMDTPCDFNKI